MNLPIHPQPSREKSVFVKQILLASFLLVGIFSILVIGVWNYYRNTLIENQKNQLMLVTQAVSQYMEISLSEYRDTAGFLSYLENSGKADTEYYDEYLSLQSSFITDIAWMDSQGNFEKSVRQSSYQNGILLGIPSEQESIWQYNDEDGHFYMAFSHKLSTGNQLCLIIDEEAYYQQIISNLNIGTNGYLVIKASDGRIILHPSQDQWGIHVIEGRRELFPDLDYSSLEEMINKQKTEEAGFAEYYSYWWTDPKVPRVKKISAFQHMGLGDDFLIISSVVDYSDFSAPASDGFRTILIVFLAIFAAYILLLSYILRLQTAKRQADHEIEYLKELNETLEEIHRSEETIAHQQRLQIMGAMTSGIAHEFNNFLTPIIGYADMLLMELPEGEESHEEAKEILNAAEKAKDVIRQISSLSRRNVETVFKSVPVKTMLTRNLRMIQAICPSHIQLEYDLDLQNECILGCSTQIHQVILNICTNAIHAIDKEGMIQIHARAISGKEAEKHLPQEKLSNDWRQYIEITIRDNGRGMDNNTLRHIFEPFFTTKPNGEGTGLGLSLAEQIIHSHRGYITAESEEGKGSCFYIFLPVLDQEKEKESSQWGQKQEIEIIIADDNKKILSMLQQSLEKLSIPVLTCSTKDELQICLDQNPSSILVVDQQLENSDGIEFCMSIAGKYPDMPRILMVNQLTREIIEAKERHIIDDYVLKPVSDTMLLNAIRKCRQS
ncbi:MAG: ATP-binding protein [Clostridiales bacterium]|nr:ATP-binding protein [Clostridiales bacterium]